MKTTTFRSTVCFLALLAMFLPSFAIADIKTAPQRHVVLIGIDNYAPSKLAPLQYCKSDVKKLKVALLQSGFSEKYDSIVTMTDDAKDASLKPTKANILNVLTNIRDRVKEMENAVKGGDKIIVYFSGHAGTFDGAPTLAPMDFDLEQPKATGLAVADMVASLKDCKADLRLFLFDAMPFLGLVDKKDLMVLPPRTAVFCAAKPGFKAYELPEFEGGIFTHHVIKGLLDEADRCGDVNGKVDLGELYLYVKTQSAKDAYKSFGNRMVPGLIVSNDIDDIFNLEILGKPSTLLSP